MSAPQRHLDTFGREPSFEGAEPQAARRAASWATRAAQPLVDSVGFILRLLDVAILGAVAMDLSGERFSGLIGGVVWLGHSLSRPFAALPAPRMGHGQLMIGGLVMVGLLIAVEVALRWVVRKVTFAPSTSAGVSPRTR